jgi:oligopeptidase A
MRRPGQETTMADTTPDNPLLQEEGLPRFSRILPEHVEPAIDAILADNRAAIAALVQQPEPSWESLIEPLEELDDRLERAWSPVSHMNSVVNSEPLRAAYNACLPKLSEYSSELGQNRELYLAYRTVAEHQSGLDDAQRKSLDNALRDFHLAGVDLPAAAQQRFREIQQELSRLTARFEEHVLDATNAWSKLISDPRQLAGLPESAMALAAQTARQQDRQGWLLTLDAPSYIPVMTYAEDRTLREELYRAYGTRASDQGPHAGQYDNGPLIEQILKLRHEQAQLLGFVNYAERSLATKMAPDTERVISFLEDLGRRARPQAEQELAELRAFAASEFGATDLQPWDIAYYSEKMRQARYRITQEELRPYFPETRVIPGLFQVIGRLFGVEIREAAGPVDTWHPDVRFYEVRDESGELMAQFYFDLYARQKKRGGAWMDVCQGRLRSSQRQQLPVAYMTCNFTPPVDGKPALLTHAEVETLFHEFGHGLHHMLTRIDCPAVAGINGVAWDAVELPSQFLENWCWQREALDAISGHWQTGKPLPDELFERMLAAKHFQAAMQMLRQLEFSLFDFRIHLEFDPARGGRIRELLQQVRDQIAVLQPPEWHRFPQSFTHIFGGGYAAGYYSYKWAEVLSADAFSLFEEKGIFDPDTGHRFRRHILEMGGSRDAMELFVAFRGREPRIEPLLRHNGIRG